MAVGVKALKDLRNVTTGALEVPAGTPGVVLQMLTTAAVQVQFSTTPTPVTRWAAPSELNFDAGKLGLLQAYLVGTTKTVLSIDYPGEFVDFSASLGTGPIAESNEMVVRFSDGTGFKVKADRNTGDLNVTLLP